MSGNTTEAGKALCPFFAGTRGTKISCTGENVGYKSTGPSFQTAKDMNEWRKNFCSCYCFLTCSHYQMISADQGGEMMET